MNTQNNSDIWQGFDLSNIQLQNDPAAAPKSSSPIPKKHQEIIQALEESDLEKLAEVISPSKTRSTFVTKALAENFSPQAGDLVFDAGLIKAGNLWNDFLAAKNVGGLGWILSSPSRIIAVENDIGISSVRVNELNGELSGSKSLLGPGGPSSALFNELPPVDFLTIVAKSDWGTLLRGGASSRLEQELFEEIIDAGTQPKVPLRVAVSACERLFQKDALSPPEGNSKYRPNIYGPQEIMASISMLNVLEKMARLPLERAARVQEIIQSSALLSQTLRVLFNKSQYEDSYPQDNNTSMIRMSLASFPHVLTASISIPGCDSTGSGFYDFRVVDNWMDFMITRAANFICQAISNPNPDTDRLYEGVLNRMKQRPELFMAFCKELPREQINSIVPRLATDLRDINPDGSPLAHLAMQANRCVAMVDALLRVNPPLNLHQPQGPLNRCALDALRQDQRTIHLMDRVANSYVKKVKNELKKVSKTIRTDLPKAPKSSNKPKM